MTAAFLKRPLRPIPFIAAILVSIIHLQAHADKKIYLGSWQEHTYGPDPDASECYTKTTVSCIPSLPEETKLPLAVGEYAMDTQMKVVRVLETSGSDVRVEYLKGNYIKIYPKKLFVPAVSSLTYKALGDQKTYAIQVGDRLIDSMSKSAKVLAIFQNQMLWVEYSYRNGDKDQTVYPAALYTRP